MRSLRATSTLSLALALTGTASAQHHVSIDPSATYLHTNQDSSKDAIAIDLAALGITPGTHLRLRQPGDYDLGPTGDNYTHLIGIFSATATLLDEGNLHRVQDAIDAGFDVLTGDTYFGTQPTDVPEDFAITYPPLTDVTVTVPAGAAFLFVSSVDSLYGDNTDPDGDYGVDIDVIGPGSFVDLGQGLAGISGVPLLAGSGALIAADPVSFTLSNARTNSLSFLIIGFTRWDAPFKGGVLVPSIDRLLALPTDATGGFQLQSGFPAGVPADLHFFMQTWIVDPTAVKGMSASNALEVITP